MIDVFTHLYLTFERDIKREKTCIFLLEENKTNFGELILSFLAYSFSIQAYMIERWRFKHTHFVTSHVKWVFGAGFCVVSWV